MNCQEIREQLDDYVDAVLDAGKAQAYQQHIAGCKACRQTVEREMLLRQQLRMLPVEPPRQGYQARVLRALEQSRTPASRPPRMAAFALAASLVIGISLVLFYGLEGVSPQPEQAVAMKIIQMEPGSEQPVRLVFNSPRELNDVELKIELPEGVEYVNNPGVRELAWHAHIKSGVNVLELPVRLTGHGGIMSASLSIGGQQRRISIRIQAQHESGRAPGRRAVQLASAIPPKYEILET